MNLSPLALAPRAALGIAKEILRHVLKRPVIGVAVAARTRDERFVLIRRGDTGTWALPGGTVEWGESLHDTLSRELSEEAGIDKSTFRRVVGVYGRVDRDPRFHAVTIVVEAEVEEPTKPQLNRLEIREVKSFSREELPRELAMGMRDYIDAVLANAPTAFE